MFVIANLSTSDWAAWYAAIVATAALVWEFYTHITKGPRLAATAILDMSDGCPEIQFSIRNVGDVPTSIERFTFVHHRRDSREFPFVVVGSAGEVLRKLQPGEHVEGRLWPPSDEAGMLQVHPSLKCLSSGWLLIRHSASSKPGFVRVEPPKKTPNKTLDPTAVSVSVLTFIGFTFIGFIMFLSFLGRAVPAVGQLGR